MNDVVPHTSKKETPKVEKKDALDLIAPSIKEVPKGDASDAKTAEIKNIQKSLTTSTIKPKLTEQTPPKTIEEISKPEKVLSQQK